MSGIHYILSTYHRAQLTEVTSPGIKGEGSVATLSPPVIFPQAPVGTTNSTSSSAFGHTYGEDICNTKIIINSLKLEKVDLQLLCLEC